jgi:hypothetical protein
MPDVTLWRIERRKLRASPGRQAALARELGTDVDDLFALEKEPPRDAAIVADYNVLRSSVQVARKHKIQKKTVLDILHGAGVSTRDRTKERITRLQRVAELDASDVPRDEMAAQLGISPSQLQADLRDLDRPKRAARRKHPKPEARTCAREGCEEVLTPTGYQVARGWGRFCSRPCARAAGRVAEPTPRECRYRHCNRIFTPWPSEAARPGHGQFCCHEHRQLHFWRDEPERVAGIIRSLEGRGLLKARGRKRVFGRLGGKKGASHGIEAGRAKGGRPPKSTPEQQQAMLLLDREGLSTRDIAEHVFGDPRYKDRVARFLRR